MQEPRRIALARDVVQRGIGEEGGVAVLGPVARRRVVGTEAAGRRVAAEGPVHFVGRLGHRVALGRQVVGPGGRLGRHPEQRREAGQQPLVTLARHRRIATVGPRVEAGVRIADQGRVVARRPGLAGNVGETGVERRAVAHRAVVHHVHAGEQRGAARAARRALGEVIGEQHAIGRQGVEVRRAHHRMAAGRQAVGAPLVGGDEEDVQRLRHDRAVISRRRPRRGHKSTAATTFRAAALSGGIFRTRPKPSARPGAVACHVTSATPRDASTMSNFCAFPTPGASPIGQPRAAAAPGMLSEGLVGRIFPIILAQ